MFKTVLKLVTDQREVFLCPMGPFTFTIRIPTIYLRPIHSNDYTMNVQHPSTNTFGGTMEIGELWYIYEGKCGS